MAQAVSRRPLTAEPRVRSRASPCGVFGGQSGTGKGFSQSTSVNFISPVLHDKEKRKKKTNHNKPEGCTASVAFAAGLFTKHTHTHTHTHTYKRKNVKGKTRRAGV
jgi:hypothetical protein